MYFLIAGSTLFFAAHFYSAFRTRLPGRDLRKKIGEAKFMGAYSLVSGVGFALMIWGFSLAGDTKELFTPPIWGRNVTLALMFPALVLIVAAYSPRGHIKNFVKHPMLLAVILWSGAHLLLNGDLRSVILFGGFLAFGLIDRISVMGRHEDIKRVSPTGDLIALIIGAGLYYLILQYLHEPIIGTAII